MLFKPLCPLMPETLPPSPAPTSRTTRDKAAFTALIVDDDRTMRESLTTLMSRSGWQVHVAARGDEATSLLAHEAVDVVISDVRMPGMSGLDLLRQQHSDLAPPFVLISAHGDVPMAVEAMQNGAYSFLEKPFDPRRLLLIAQHAAERYHLKCKNARLTARLAAMSGLDRVLVGEHASITTLREDILHLAGFDMPVMILGETGTGKDVVARALHDLSERAAGPFVAVNCATISPDHVDRLMFGDADGRPGYFKAADGGTLFLDELALFPADLQGKLLRALETHEIMPVGSIEPCKVNIRVLSATNEDPTALMADGIVREDLIYRLNNMTISLSPLRERADDIALLFTSFLHHVAGVYEISPPDLSPDDLATLFGHDWPGNVRELRHVAERFALLSRRGACRVSQVLHPGPGPHEELDAMPGTLREAVAAFERQMIAKAIQAHDGRMNDVAASLGIGRRTLNEKIVKLNLDKAALV